MSPWSGVNSSTSSRRLERCWFIRKPNHCIPHLRTHIWYYSLYKIKRGWMHTCYLTTGDETTLFQSKIRFTMRLHPCRHCGESFGTHTELRRHLRSHTTPSSDHTYSSTLPTSRTAPPSADHTYVQSSDITATGRYVCPGCGKYFSRRCNMLRHVRYLALHLQCRILYQEHRQGALQDGRTYFFLSTRWEMVGFSY